MTKWSNFKLSRILGFVLVLGTSKRGEAVVEAHAVRLFGHPHVRRQHRAQGMSKRPFMSEGGL